MHAHSSNWHTQAEGVLSFTEETSTIHLASKLPVGQAVLTIDYKGELNNKMCGFYRAKASQDGNEWWMAVTQVLSTHGDLFPHLCASSAWHAQLYFYVSSRS